MVAWKLQKIRRLRRLSQTEAGVMLEPYLGHRLSRAAFSQAERCLDKGKIRRFDADEIVAFARAFEVPVPYFFGPAEPHRHGKRVIINGKPGNGKSRVSSPPLTVHEMNALAQGTPSEAVLVRLGKVVAPSHARAIANGVCRYLKENPDRLIQILRGEIPKELWDKLTEEIETPRTAHSEKILAETVLKALRFKD